MDLKFQFSLGSDNHAGVHPTILQAIEEMNESHAPSYGTDSVTQRMNQNFKKVFGPTCQPFLVFNGTAANVLSIKALIPSWRSVLCTDISHLQLDECGAPEALTGSKLQLVRSVDGKLRVESLEKEMIRLGDQHYSSPGMISITQPTELGTVYSFEEMKRIRDFANKYKLRVHIDGARFANAAAFLKCELKEIYETLKPDAISFGGTKNGLLGAEAVLLFDEQIIKDFKFIRKQMMQLPSKTRFLAAQFNAYLEEALYKQISNQSLQMARRLREGLQSVFEIEVLHPVESNAVFAKIPKKWTKPLKETLFFYVWDEHDWSVRLMPSFDTTPEHVDLFIEKAKSLSGEKL